MLSAHSRGRSSRVVSRRTPPNSCHGLAHCVQKLNCCDPVFHGCLRRVSRSSVRHSVSAMATAVAQVLESGLEYGIACAQGPRDSMEDELSLIPDGPEGRLIANVFDGHGGPAAAIWLNDNLYDYVRGALIEGYDDEESLIAAFKEADRDLLQYLECGTEDGEVLTGAGATASVLLVSSDKVVSANVGDSTAILCRKARDIRLTVAHRVYGNDEEAQEEVRRVKKAGGWVSDGRVCDVLAVSRAFGDWEFKGEGLQSLLKEGVDFEWWDQEFADSVNFTADPVIAIPATSTIDISAEAGDEFLVVASDGLWDFYPQSEAIQFARISLKGGRTAQQVADDLVDRALKRYTSDNVAVIVIKFPWAFKETARSKAPKKKVFGLF